MRKLVLGIPAQASGKNLTRPLMPPAAPIRPRHFVPTQQGVGTLAPNDLTAFRDALQVFSASLRKPARRYAYRGLKIFTSLSLHFHDFQRLVQGLFALDKINQFSDLRNMRSTCLLRDSEISICSFSTFFRQASKTDMKSCLSV